MGSIIINECNVIHFRQSASHCLTDNMRKNAVFCAFTHTHIQHHTNKSNAVIVLSKQNLSEYQIYYEFYLKFILFDTSSASLPLIYDSLRLLLIIQKIR